MENKSQTDLSPVCDLNALTREQRTRQQQLFEQLHQGRQEIQELPNGYAWRFAPDAAMYLIIAEFLTLEHRCCPSFTHTLELAPGKDGPLWLRITGGEAEKEFLRAELGLTA